MKIIITSALKKWLARKKHPNAMEMASKLNIDTLTNSMVQKKLGLSSTWERQFDIFPTELLEWHYDKYY